MTDLTWEEAFPYDEWWNDDYYDPSGLEEWYDKDGNLIPRSQWRQWLNRCCDADGDPGMNDLWEEDGPDDGPDPEFDCCDEEMYEYLCVNWAIDKFPQVAEFFKHHPYGSIEWRCDCLVAHSNDRPCLYHRNGDVFIVVPRPEHDPEKCKTCGRNYFCIPCAEIGSVSEKEWFEEQDEKHEAIKRELQEMWDRQGDGTKWSKPPHEPRPRTKKTG